MSLYQELPAVLADIIRNYVKPEFELAELQSEYHCRIFVLGEIKPEILELLPSKTGMFSMRWIIHTKDRCTITYDPVIMFGNKKEEPADPVDIKEEFKMYAHAYKNNICYKCDKKAEPRFIIPDIAGVYLDCTYNEIANPDPGSENHGWWSYTSIKDPTNYQVCCFDCLDKKNFPREIKENDLYFVDNPTYSPVLLMLNIMNDTQNWQIYYHRGLKRDKFQLVDHDAGEVHNNLVEIHIISEMHHDLYSYIKFIIR